MKKVNMFGVTQVLLSITGKDSHKLELEQGTGGITIGTEGETKEKVDILVDKDKSINWNTFNGFYVPATWEKRHLYPYGTWPRGFRYYGNDLGFIKWSEKRKIENFHFFPSKEMSINLKNGNIDTFEINNKYKTELYLGKKLSYLILSGNLENYIVKECEGEKILFFYPKIEKGKTIYKIPTYNTLKDTQEIHIYVKATSAPFDCSSLLQFKKLKTLYLIGNITNLNALSELKELEKIGIWDAPNLIGMPSLNTFKNLEELVAVNVGKKGGLLLRKQLKELSKVRKLKLSVVEKLRDELWFKENYDLPFKYWIKENGEKANKAYKICLKNVKIANTLDEVQKAIMAFIKKINKLEFIETSEWDDFYDAINVIIKNSPIEISDDIWVKWFYETKKND